MHNKNKNGEKGSPCLIPFVGLMNPIGAPFIRMEYDTVEIQSIISDIHCL